METGTASHGLGTTCCATPADHHTYKHNRTPRIYHQEPEQPTLTNDTTLHLDKPRRNSPAPKRTCRLQKQHLAIRPPAAARRNPRNPDDHEASKTTVHKPDRSCSRDLTVNRPHASRPTSNQPGVHGSKRERLPTGRPRHDAPRPPTTIPMNKTQHCDSTLTQPTNQH